MAKRTFAEHLQDDEICLTIHLAKGKNAIDVQILFKEDFANISHLNTQIKDFNPDELI
jgi:hypothetical protein